MPKLWCNNVVSEGARKGANKARKAESLGKRWSFLLPPSSAGLRVPAFPVPHGAWGCMAGSSLPSTLPMERLYFQFLCLCQTESV